MKKNSKRITEVIYIILPAIFILGICILNGLRNIDNANFFPMNGTYQNYNVWRRIYDGQMPFKDFEAFYGFGQVFVGAITTYILGGTYADSMVANDFLAMLSFSILVLSVLYCNLYNFRKAIYGTLLICSFAVTFPRRFYSFVPSEIISMIQISQNNNNARMLRAAIVPIAVLSSIFIGLYFKRYRKQCDTYTLAIKFSRTIGIVMGISILWENCMGISVFLSFSLVWFLFLLCNYPKEFKKVFVAIINYVASLLISFFVILMLLTKGNAVSYIKNTILMSRSFYWYTNNGPKIVHISDLPIDIWILAGILLFVFYLYNLLRKHDLKTAIPDLCRTFMILSAILSNYLYNWSSGGLRKDILIPIVFVTCLSQLYRVGYDVIKKGRVRFTKKYVNLTVCIGILLISAGVILYQCRVNVKMIYQTRNGGTYFNELGGYVDRTPKSRWSAKAEDIKIGVDTVGNATLFSTFSTAVDVILDIYQPTGFDYMEHALGKDNQRQYLETFEDIRPLFVQTMHKDHNPWDVWDKGQNWYFWEQLYRNYEPWTSNSTSIYWRYKGEESAFSPSVSYAIEKIDRSSYRIKVISDCMSPFVVSADIAYHCDDKWHMSAGLLRKMVEVNDVSYINILEDTEFGFFLPQRESRYVPISVINGYGEIILRVHKAPEVDLFIDHVVLGKSYETPYSYLHCEDYSDEEFDRGADLETLQLLLPDTIYNRTMVDGIISIVDHNGQICKIKEAEYNNDGYIVLKVVDGADLEYFKYPNMFKIERESERIQ